MRKKTAEMLWLVLPAVILGGVGLFFKMRGASQSDRPLRVELGKFRATEVQPVEVFRGYRYQVSSQFRTLGTVPDEMRKLSEPRWDGLLCEAGLEAQRRGKWVPWTWKKRALIVVSNNAVEGELRISMGLPDTVPSDIEALRIKGTTAGRFNVEVPAVPGANPNGVYRTPQGYVSGTNGRFYAQQKLAAQPLNEVIWKRGQPWPRPQINKHSSLSLSPVGQVRPYGYWPGHNLKCKPSDRRDFYFEADVIAPDSDVKTSPLSLVKAELLDDEQRVLTTEGDGRLSLQSWGSSFVPSDRDPKPRVFVGAYDTSISQSNLVLRVYVSHDSEWPTRLDIPLREAWQARNPRLLQLQKVKLIKSPPEVYPPGGVSVEVTVRYLGKRKLWSFNRDVATPPSITTYGGFRTQVAPPATGYEELLFDPQPCLRDEVGEIIENKGVGMAENPVHSRDPILQPNGTLTLVFPLQLEPGHRFKAATFDLRLGIAGDGVLKIRQQLPVQTLMQAVVQPTATPTPQ